MMETTPEIKAALTRMEKLQAHYLRKAAEYEPKNMALAGLQHERAIIVGKCHEILKQEAGLLS